MMSKVLKDPVLIRNYHALNPDSSAIGAFQIMPTTLPGWFEEVYKMSFREALESSLKIKMPNNYIQHVNDFFVFYKKDPILTRKIKALKKEKKRFTSEDDEYHIISSEILKLNKKKKRGLKKMRDIIYISNLDSADVQESLARYKLLDYFDEFGDWAKVAGSWYAGSGWVRKHFKESMLHRNLSEERIDYYGSKNTYSGKYTYIKNILINFKKILGKDVNSCVPYNIS